MSEHANKGKGDTVNAEIMTEGEGPDVMTKI